MGKDTDNGTSNYQNSAIMDQLIDLIKSRSFKSVTRIAIIILLGINGTLTFTQLQKALNIGKGSLKNHLDMLEADGFIRSKNIFTLRGPRLLYSITEKGEEFYGNYVQLLSKLMQRGNSIRPRINTQSDD